MEQKATRQSLLDFLVLYGSRGKDQLTTRNSRKVSMCAGAAKACSNRANPSVASTNIRWALDTSTLQERCADGSVWLAQLPLEYYVSLLCLSS